MWSRRIAAGGIVAAVLLSGARCGSPDELAALSKTLSNEAGAGSGLLAKARSVKVLSGLSDEERALQSQLLAQTDQRVLRLSTAAMDQLASSAERTAGDTAKSTAETAVKRPVKPTFAQDLTDVTEELVKEHACQLVLDQVAPAPEEPGKSQSWTDLPAEVVGRMVSKRWARPSHKWDEFLAWDQYVAGVAEDGSRVAKSLLADDSTIELFARPSVQRAALAYARFCYATPRSV